MEVGLIRAWALLRLCCCYRENHSAVMSCLMRIVKFVLVGRRREYIRRRDVVLASLSSFSFDFMRGNPEDRGLRRDRGVEDVDTGNEKVSYGRESCE